MHASRSAMRAAAKGDHLTGPDIFISYSREDRETARYFSQCFSEQGFSVWWDAALHSGETFDEVIERELRAARAVVVLWSPRSVASRWVRAEATIADRRKTLVPVVIEACDRPIIFELTHTVDLSAWSGDVADKLFQILLYDLRRMVGRGKESVATADAAHAGPAAKAAEQFVPRSFQKKAEPDDLNEINRLVRRLSVVTPAPQREPATARINGGEEDRTQIFRRADHEAAEQFHCLELHDGDQLERRYIVHKSGLKIGRTAPADVILTDTRVSRSHCMVELANNTLRVLDLESTNGTFVDGHRVSGQAVLDVGSELRVGNITLKHELRSRAEV